MLSSNPVADQKCPQPGTMTGSIFASLTSSGFVIALKLARQPFAPQGSVDSGFIKQGLLAEAANAMIQMRYGSNADIIMDQTAEESGLDSCMGAGEKCHSFWNRSVRGKGLLVAPVGIAHRGPQPWLSSSTPHKVGHTHSSRPSGPESSPAADGPA